jgi:hypothetical protein
MKFSGNMAMQKLWGGDDPYIYSYVFIYVRVIFLSYNGWPISVDLDFWI